jgi:hypothetical protein
VDCGLEKGFRLGDRDERRVVGVNVVDVLAQLFGNVVVVDDLLDGVRVDPTEEIFEKYASPVLEGVETRDKLVPVNVGVLVLGYALSRDRRSERSNYMECARQHVVLKGI